MASPSDLPDGHVLDACGELRLEVGARCDEAHRAQVAHAGFEDGVRARKRDLVAAQHRLVAATEAADPRARGAEKASARAEYLEASRRAETEAQHTEATAAWARAIDRVNRTGRLAARAVSSARQEVGQLEATLLEAERAERTARIQAEAAQAACLDARVRLAACEEGLESQAPPRPASVFDPHAATAGHAIALSDTRVGGPLVIEAIVSGDRLALEEAARAIAAHGGLTPAEAQLELQELVDAILSAASSEGYLAFHGDHGLWSQMTIEEARLVVAALARLGFHIEPAEGWQGGRAPGPADLSVALGYAGLDPRQMRWLPGAEELRALPQSIDVDARSFLSERAPDLTVDHMVRVLERRAAQLEPLWDAWGHVRPILLSERLALESMS
jgi:hypothetical protein